MSDETLTGDAVRAVATLTAQTVRVMGAAAEAPDLIHYAVPEGARIETFDLSAYRDGPRRIASRVTLAAPADLVGYVGDFSTGTARVFADPDARRIKAVLDYHEGRGPDSPPVPRHCRHVAACEVRLDPAYEAWERAATKGVMAQRAFAEFLEDHAEDAVSPEPADLIEVARNFDAARNVTFRSAVNLHTGERQFRYEEADSGKGAIACPKVIALRTPVFEGQTPRDWAVRFGYRIEEGKLAFTISIHRRRQLLDTAWADLVTALAGELAPAARVHNGRVEAT